MTGTIGGVCIVTQPGGEHEKKSHERDLARIVSEITTTVVLTANISADSPLREEQAVIEYSSSSAGGNFLFEALHFVLNQIRLCRVLIERDEEIVLFFGTTAYVAPVAVARLTGRRVAVLPRGDVPLSARLRWEEHIPSVLARFLAGCVSLLEHFSYQIAHAIVAYTPSMAETLGLMRYDHKLYPHGARFIDTDEFNVQTPFDERDQTIGFVGRLDVEKRIPVLTEMVKYLPEDIRVVFVGDGAYRTQLERELSDEIQNGRVEVMGWVPHDEVPKQYNRLRLLLLPSTATEGLPTTILEGMACGTPSFATPVSGVPDVVQHCGTGFIMDDVSGKILADEVVEILKREDLSEISEEARQLIEDEYSFESAVKRYEMILANIVDSG